MTKRKEITSNSFEKLLTDSLFINKNIRMLGIDEGEMVAKYSLKGRIYFSNTWLPLSETEDVKSILNKIDLVDEVFLYTEDYGASIRKDEYIGHKITESHIEISLNNGQVRRLYF